MRAALALVVLLGSLVVPAASAAVDWGGNRFDGQPELCAWLRSHRSRCDVWAIRHPEAWQALASSVHHPRPPQSSSRRVLPAIRTSGPTRAMLALLAALALVLSLAPVPGAVQRRAGPRTLGIRIALATFACAVATGLALAAL